MLNLEGSDDGSYLCPSFGILKTREYNVSETESVSVLRWRGKASTLLAPLERANLNHWGGEQMQFPKRWVLLFSEYGTMDEVQKLTDSQRVHISILWSVPWGCSSGRNTASFYALWVEWSFIETLHHGTCQVWRCIELAGLKWVTEL
jgi:hypothetical protein